MGGLGGAGLGRPRGRVGDSKSKGQGLKRGRMGRVGCNNVQCEDQVPMGAPSSGLCQRRPLLPGVNTAHRATVL